MDPSKERMSQRLLCINCKICVNTMRRYPVLQLDAEVVSLISRWISPVMITEEDNVCEKCFDKSMQIINGQIESNNESDPYDGPSHRGHTNVCLICGRSILNRQSHCILQENPTDLSQRITKLIQTALEPRQISQSDGVCHACWQRFKRRVLSTQTHEGRDSNDWGKPEAGGIQFEGVFIVDKETSLKEEEQSVPVAHSKLTQTEPMRPEQSSDIKLLNYRRAPNTNNHCVFFGCEKRLMLHDVSDAFRATLMFSHKLYIPKRSKVCADHLHGNNDWDVLYSSEKSMTGFTADMVEHVFSLVNAFKPILDFSSLKSVQEMDKNLFEFWMGLSKSKFLSLLEELPGLKEKHRGIFGLAAVVIKMHTGYTDAKVSTVLEVPRSTLERLMKSATKILLENLFPDNLDGDNLTMEQLIERIGFIHS